MIGAFFYRILRAHQCLSSVNGRSPVFGRNACLDALRAASFLPPSSHLVLVLRCTADDSFLASAEEGTMGLDVGRHADNPFLGEVVWRAFPSASRTSSPEPAWRWVRASFQRPVHANGGLHERADPRWSRLPRTRTSSIDMTDRIKNRSSVSSGAENEGLRL